MFEFYIEPNLVLHFMMKCLQTKTVRRLTSVWEQSISSQGFSQILLNMGARLPVLVWTIRYRIHIFLNFIGLRIYFYTYFRSPSYSDNLIKGYQSLNKEIILVDISNDEIKAIPNPRIKSMTFWTDLENKARRN